MLVPLMEKFKELYGHYPNYPVADAGYGSYNNDLYCEEHGMENLEIYECESCEGYQYKKECCPKTSKNRTIHMNQELTAIHQEVITNLESIHGTLLRINRSIQAERTFGIIKWDKSYRRLFRRGKKNVILELTLISCGFNLSKNHKKRQRKEVAA